MNNSADMNDLYRDPMFNPMAQYEQAYCYYRYLCMQIYYISLSYLILYFY